MYIYIPLSTHQGSLSAHRVYTWFGGVLGYAPVAYKWFGGPWVAAQPAGDANTRPRNHPPTDTQRPHAEATTSTKQPFPARGE